MTTCELSIQRSRCRVSPKTGFGSRLARILELMACWDERYRQRRDLMAMPDHLLKDIGVTREEVYREARKPFWQA